MILGQVVQCEGPVCNATWSSVLLYAAGAQASKTLSIPTLVLCMSVLTFMLSTHFNFIV